jgi:hypothetical protein
MVNNSPRKEVRQYRWTEFSFTYFYLLKMDMSQSHENACIEGILASSMASWRLMDAYKQSSNAEVNCGFILARSGGRYAYGVLGLSRGKVPLVADGIYIGRDCIERRMPIGVSTRPIWVLVLPYK